MSDTTPPAADGPASAPQPVENQSAGNQSAPVNPNPPPVGDPAQPAQSSGSPADAPAAAPSPVASTSAPQAQPPSPAERAAEHGEPAGGAKVVVRYGLMANIGEFRHNLATPPRVGAKVVVRTERGVELGTVLTAISPTCEQGQACGRCISAAALGSFVRACGDDYPFRRDGKILRLANAQDVNDQRHLDSGTREEDAYCRQKIVELKLPMRLVTVEHLLGGERIIFYFSSESRVDFRDLVRSLATQYRTRIEMHQVGARDEARLVADYERCGQRCCCQQFLKNLQPVSMRMAKTQKATLDPTKISGRCGRLMCCLRYEDAGYEELRKMLPRKNIWVRTGAGVVGRVIDTQIITQLVRLALVDNTQLVVGNEEIVARNVEPPPMPPPDAPRPHREPKVKAPLRMLRDEFNQPADAEAAPQASLSEQQALENQDGQLPGGAVGEGLPEVVEVSGPVHEDEACEEVDRDREEEIEEPIAREPQGPQLDQPPQASPQQAARPQPQPTQRPSGQQRPPFNQPSGQGGQGGQGGRRHRRRRRRGRGHGQGGGGQGVPGPRP